jgi:hyaluronate lyase
LSIASGLDWMNTNVYNSGATISGNWWDWQIGGPQAMLDVCALMYSHLTASEISDNCAAIDHFVTGSVINSYTAANRVDLCHVVALRGVVGKNSSSLTTARDGLTAVFPTVTTGDGYYADGSYIQHGRVPYAGTYGDVLLGGLSRMLVLLAGTTWAVTDSHLPDLFAAVDNCWAPFLYNGLVMDGVSGRAVSRGISPVSADPLQIEQSEHTRGHAVLGDILRLAESGAATSAEAADWKGKVKGWINRDTTSPYMSDKSVDIPELARAQALVNDSTITGAAEAVFSKVYGMDRAVHRRSSWAAQVSMCSSRTSFYETGNNENLHGWHQNAGMLYWYGNTYGNAQYSNGFWATVDPYMLPGTTVSTKVLAAHAGGDWNAAYPVTAWAGGASDGTYSVAGQKVRGVTSTLTGMKSWFCLDDSIMCLGTGITCTDTVDVQTTVDNRCLGVGNTNTFTVDGTPQSTTLGWSHTFTDPGYMALSGQGAWVFPSGGTVNVKRAARTGAWSDINSTRSTTSVTRNYVSMWFDHGTDPSGAEYAYQLMPGATTTQAAARVATPNVTVLANTTTAQAITATVANSLGLTMANFFATGTAGSITVSAPCSVLVNVTDGKTTVAVSDPPRNSTTINVTIAGSLYTSIIAHSGKTVSSSSGITVQSSTSSQIVLQATTDGKMGTSQTITLIK